MVKFTENGLNYKKKVGFQFFVPKDILLTHA